VDAVDNTCLSRSWSFVRNLIAPWLHPGRHVCVCSLREASRMRSALLLTQLDMNTSRVRAAPSYCTSTSRTSPFSMTSWLDRTRPSHRAATYGSEWCVSVVEKTPVARWLLDPWRSSRPTPERASDCSLMMTFDHVAFGRVRHVLRMSPSAERLSRTHVIFAYLELTFTRRLRGS
jgi:hypothetical protein